MRKSFKLENLDCANCAAKMEAGISELPGVNKASISFMTSKLLIDADTEDFDALLYAAQQVCTSFEKDCRIVREPLAKAASGQGAMLDAQFRSERNSPVGCFAERGLFEHRVLPPGQRRTTKED